MESINLCTFCARAVVRIDQFVVFCCWLVLFVCTWLLFSSFFDTCHAQNTPGVGMESINLCTFCARAVVRIDQFVVFCCWLVLFVCTRLLFSSIFLIRTIISRPVGWSRDGGVRETMRVELTSGGGAFPAWGMGERCKLPIGVWGGAPAALQLLQC